MSKNFFLQEVLELAFSILYDPDETLNFIAPNKYEVRNGAVKLQRGDREKTRFPQGLAKVHQPHY